MHASILLVAILTQTRLGAPTSGKIAILEPLVDPRVFTAEGARIDPFAAADRVTKRFASEAKGWKGWLLTYASYADVLRAQRKQFGDRANVTSYSDPKKLNLIASQLRVRYVAFYNLLEFTGARTAGVSRRTTGRASIDLTVYDSAIDKFVWQDKKTETSIRSGTKAAMQPRMDQALLNCLREALEPFAVEGYRKEISR